jgi:acetyl esterase
MQPRREVIDDVIDADRDIDSDRDLDAGADPDPGVERDVAAVHPELRELYRRARPSFVPDVTSTAAQLRARGRNPIVAGLIESVELHEVRDLEIPTADGARSARLYRPTEFAGLPGHVHFHGGGWALGSVADSDEGARLLAARLGAAVVSVDYRLAPEHPWPAGPEDCYAATTWVADNATALGIDAGDLTIGGDSAGANLATVVALMCRDRGGPQLRAQWLALGAFDLTLPGTPSMQRYGRGFVIDRLDLERWVGWYVDPSQRREPYVSPVFADVHGLPPAVIVSASCDPLYDQSLAFADHLRAAGVGVTEVRCEGHVHGSQFLTAATASARAHHAAAVSALVAARGEVLS